MQRQRLATLLFIGLSICSIIWLGDQTPVSHNSFNRSQNTIHALGSSSQNTNPSIIQPFSIPSASSNVGIVGEQSPDNQQVETTIAVDPHNPSVIVAGAQDLRLKPNGHRWHGYYRSIDSGLTWTTSLVPGFPGDASSDGLSSPLHGSNATSDPVITIDRFGNVYYAGLIFNITSNGNVSGALVFVARYTNDGATYVGTTLIKGPLFADKEWIVTDNTGGTYDGNLYLVFDANLTATQPFGTLFTKSTDGGRTFSTPFYAPADKTGELPGVTVDGNGNVYVSTDAFNPITGANLNYIQVTKITNGGTVLAQNVHAVDPAYWLTGPPLGAQFRAFTIPQIAADKLGVYLVYDDMRLGNANVYFTRSLDFDVSWQTPIIVNDVMTGQHFFPTITVSSGFISVAWYDSRLNTASTMTTLDVYYAESVNDGASFTNNIRVTDTSFNPDGVPRTDQPYSNNPYFMGDYIGISSSPNQAHAIWSDNRNMGDTVDPTWGCIDQDAYTAQITISSLPQGGGGAHAAYAK